MAKFEDLKGMTLVSVTGEVGGDVVEFKTTDGRTFRLHHYQDCCESVDIESITGDLSDLVGHPILVAEESCNSGENYEDWPESFTWTFYKLATIKGYVDIRWYGSSNGYYSEDVYFDEVTN